MKKLMAALLMSGATLASAQTADDLRNDGKNTENLLSFGQNPKLQMYSPLRQINKSNVRKLVPLWATSTMSETGELAQPVVYDGVMYVTNGHWTFALDVGTGKQIWRTPVEYDRAVLRISSSGAIYRGAPTLYNGKLFRLTLDAHVVALDMKTGKQVWKKPFANHLEGYKGVSAPLIANGVMITGTSGGEHATRGFLVGWDPETGNELWRKHMIPAPGEPGHETWPKTADSIPDAWKIGGASTWQNGSYDPELDLVYWGVGNAGPYDPKYRGEGDALYTNCVVAIRPKTGEIVWHYQYTPNDLYDVDATNELVLAELRINGQMRKVVMNGNKNGYFYVIDRTNGKLIAAHPMTRINWATHVDLKTGRPVLTDVGDRLRKGEEVEVFPQRGTNAVMFAFNPRNNTAYYNTWDLPRIQKFVPYKFQKLGEPNTATAGRNAPQKEGDVVGHYVAMDVITGKFKWKHPIVSIANSASSLVTDGGIVITGKPTGEVLILDEETGKELWQFKTTSSINAPPITYTHKGVQYITVPSGLGGSLPRRQSSRLVPSGSSIWTFALSKD